MGRSAEQGCLYAGVINDLHRAAGRSGVGTVMASKDLKAVAVRGTRGVGNIKNSIGLEYEAAWALGADTGVDDLDALTYANFLCNEDRMDPISFGATVAAATGLCRLGVLSKAERLDTARCRDRGDQDQARSMR